MPTQAKELHMKQQLPGNSPHITNSFMGTPTFQINKLGEWPSPTWTMYLTGSLKRVISLDTARAPHKRKVTDSDDLLVQTDIACEIIPVDVPVSRPCIWALTRGRQGRSGLTSIYLELRAKSFSCNIQYRI